MSSGGTESAEFVLARLELARTGPTGLGWAVFGCDGQGSAWLSWALLGLAGLCLTGLHLPELYQLELAWDKTRNGFGWVQLDLAGLGLASSMMQCCVSLVCACLSSSRLDRGLCFSRLISSSRLDWV